MEHILVAHLPNKLSYDEDIVSHQSEDDLDELSLVNLGEILAVPITYLHTSIDVTVLSLLLIIVKFSKNKFGSLLNSKSE